MSIKVNGKTVAEGIRIINASDFSAQLDALVNAGVLTIQQATAVMEGRIDDLTADVNQLVISSLSLINNTTAEDKQKIENETNDGLNELNTTKDNLIEELMAVGFKNVGDVFYSLRTDDIVNGAYRCLGQEFPKERFVGVQNPYDLIVSGKLNAYSMLPSESARDYITYQSGAVSGSNVVFEFLQVGIQAGKTAAGFNNILTEYAATTLNTSQYYGNVTPASLGLTDYSSVGICAFTDAAGTQSFFIGSLIEGYTYFYSTEEPEVSTYAFWYNPAENEWQYKVSGNPFQRCYATPILYTINNGAITVSPKKTVVSEYDHQLELNLECPWFGIDTVNERFKLPTLPKTYIQGEESMVGYYYPYVQIYGGDKDISLIDYTEEVNQAIVEAKAELDEIVDDEKQEVYDYAESVIDDVNQSKADAQAAAEAAQEAISALIVPATNTRLGGIKVGDGLNVENDGTLSVDTGNDETLYAWKHETSGNIIYTTQLRLDCDTILYNADGTKYTGVDFRLYSDFTGIYIQYRREDCVRDNTGDTTKQVTMAEMFQRLKALEEKGSTWQ